MGIPWRQIISVGAGIGSAWIPGLATAIQVIEANAKKMTGPEKREAAKAMARVIIASAEGTAGKDLVNDAKVEQATDRFIDTYVAAENMKAAFEDAREALIEAIALARAAKNSAAPDDDA